MIQDQKDSMVDDDGITVDAILLTIQGDVTTTGNPTVGGITAQSPQ